MASKSEVHDALKTQLENWQKDKGVGRYDTGYGGRYVRSEETVSMSDLEDAARDFKSDVTSTLGPLYSVRVAKSLSGGEHNEWSVLIEKAGAIQSLFNFHIRVA